MTHSMPSKALWESGFAFLSSWLGDFWSAPAKLRGFFTLMKSLELVVQHTGMHSLTQPLVHMHRFCMFISLYSDNSQNFAAEELSKKFRKYHSALPHIDEASKSYQETQPSQPTSPSSL